MIYILVDKDKIVRCIATEESNLHKDKLATMDQYHVEMKGTVGDEYDAATDEWTPRPENYPQPRQEALDDFKIRAEMAAMQRAEAIQSLKDKGELPIDYIDIDIGL